MGDERTAGSRGIRYRWVDDERALAAVIADLAREPAYAIDTEFHSERTYFPRLALLQLAWSSGLVLIDPLRVDIAPIGQVLSGPGVAVAHACEQDLGVLQHSCGATPRAVFDTQLAAGFVGLSSPSLSTLADRTLGVRLTKGDRLTDWIRRPLTRNQREYAASDVAYLLDIRRELVCELEALGRLRWAEEECALLRQKGRGEPDEAWWRLRECRQLRGGSRNVAQALAAWREREAARVDRPARFVLPDLAVVSISQRAPATRGELRQVRGLDGRNLNGERIDAILGAIGTGRAMPDSDLHLPPSKPAGREQRAAVALAAAWVAQKAADSRVDASLLGTRADVGELLGGVRDARLARGWRWDLVGRDLVRLAGGAAAIAVDGDRLRLEERSPGRAPATSAGG